MRLLPDIRIVLSAAQFLSRGAVAYEFSRAIGAEYWMVQHGLLVPQAPPLPVGCTLLAFSEADAEFWASGRRDVTTHAVGSQLLYLAAQKAAGAEVQKSERPGTDLPGTDARCGTAARILRVRFALLLEEVWWNLPPASEREGQAVGADPQAVGEGRHPH